MGFLSGEHVLVRQQDEDHWVLEEELRYQGRDQLFVVEKGTITDFASVPRPFAWLVPAYGRYTAAAVLHDYLWNDGVRDGLISPVDADGVFRRAMRELKVPFLLRWFMWGAVRWASLTTAQHRHGWLRTLPQLLLATLAALPVVTLPGVAIVVGYVVFLAMEAVTYGLLWILPPLRGGEPINPPTPSLRT